jgi:hypothetical protein
MTLDAFKALAGEKGMFTDYPDYYYSFATNALEMWLNDAKLGDVTSKTLKVGNSYLVAIYYADGVPAWNVIVEESINAEKQNEFVTGISAKYIVTYNDKVFTKIEA